MTDRLDRADSVLLRINLLSLLVIAFVPFPTRLIADAIHDSDEERVFVTFYGLTLLTIRLLGAAFDAYARRENLYTTGVADDEVLVDRRTAPVNATPGCTIVSGQWFSAYDGQTVTNAADIEIDHVVALKEAWDSGAFAWDDARLAAFGNDLTDPRTLAAVTAFSNQAKSDGDPSHWLPPLVSDQCPYVGNWLAIKARWGLTIDRSEYDCIANLLQGQCFGLLVPPITPVPASL